MPLTLYNTRTKQCEPFEPLTPDQVRMYVCGPTVYERAHLGNARPVVVFDVLYRLLSLSYDVTYVRNITDIDDKIIKASQTSGMSIEDITSQTTQFFHEDMASLGALPPTHEPRATAHVPDMIAFIEKLMEKGHAYESQGHVLFDVPSWPTYGCLSNCQQDEILAGARVEVAPYKKNPSDFVLWKPSSDDQPGWTSPWGRGRPGWHIECSAMAFAYLGETFDLHGGGRDLLFPHHENEIAQSTAAFGTESFAHTWVHNGILTVNGEKMSKSLGNFITVQDLFAKAHPETIRFALLSTHYRHSLDWTDQSIVQAKAALDRFYTALRGFEEDPDSRCLDKIFVKFMEDDLNTPGAIARLHELTTLLNKATIPERKLKLQRHLKACGYLLGILDLEEDEWFRTAPTKAGDLAPARIEALIQERLNARNSKNYDKADEVRKILEDGGILLEDNASGTIWRRK